MSALPATFSIRHDSQFRMWIYEFILAKHSQHNNSKSSNKIKVIKSSSGCWSWHQKTHCAPCFPFFFILSLHVFYSWNSIIFMMMSNVVVGLFVCSFDEGCWAEFMMIRLGDINDSRAYVAWNEKRQTLNENLKSILTHWYIY